MLLFVTPAAAQVTTDTQALDKLAPAAQQPAAPAPAPAPKHRAHVAAPKKLPAIGMPAAPPLHPVIQPPPFVMPSHAPPPPPPVPVRDDAPGVATPITAGTRLTFGAGVSDLNPATLAAIQAIGTKALADPASIISITAWAPGTADDPSTARRLSLDRALAVRAVLIHAGLVSDKIRAVAKGNNDIGAGPADRADVTLGK